MLIFLYRIGEDLFLNIMPTKHSTTTLNLVFLMSYTNISASSSENAYTNMIHKNLRVRTVILLEIMTHT